MDKLIRVSKSKKAEEPLLDIEERRHNYDDRRAYTSYDEITKDFEDDFRCQDICEDDAKPLQSLGTVSGRHTVTSVFPGGGVTLTDVPEQRLLIANSNASNGSCSRQRKQPILEQEARASAVGSIPHANAVGLECASTRRDARSAVASGAVTNVDVDAARGSDTSHHFRTDSHLRVKSSKTLQESIRESLTINNSAPWNNHESLGKCHRSNNHLIFEMNEFYIDMLERLNEMRKSFGNRAKVPRDVPETGNHPTVWKDFENWILADGHNNVFDGIENEPQIRTTSDICKYDPNVVREFDNIRQLDEEIKRVDLEWKTMKRERLEIQKNLCDHIEQRNDIDFQRSQVFLDLCVSETDSEEKPPALETKNEDASKEKQKLKGSAQMGKNFMKRNVEIAKNMSFPVSLTDEEKLKLDAILAEKEAGDVDIVDESTEEYNSFDSKEDDGGVDMTEAQINSKNEYKLLEEDWGRVSEIDYQIKSLSNLEEGILVNDVQCQLEDDAKLGKNWKYSLLDDRLKEIDGKLVAIKHAREAEDEGSVLGEKEVPDIINQSGTSLGSIEVTV